MGYAITIIVLLAILAIVSGMFNRGKSRTKVPENAPFRRNKYFLTTAEHSFYGCLKRAVGGRHELFVKVRLLDALWLPPQTEGKQRWRNLVQSKHIDFLLCDSSSLLPLLAVELDDSSHKRADRQDRDALVDKVLGDAGIPVLRVPAKASYDIRTLAEDIQKSVDANLQTVTAR